MKKIGLVLIFALLCVSLVSAQEPTAEQFSIAINTVWVLISAFLVFFMQAGFAMVESGFVRAKNAVNVLMKNLIDFCISSLAFWAVGYGIMFGVGNWFMGTSGFFMQGLGEMTSGIPTTAFWFWQLVFAGTATTIVSGAVAERIKFKAYLLYSAFISILVYPIVGHWIWGGGWLATLGMLDFAGSTVVHAIGGGAALAGAIMLGARIGKFNKDGTANAIPGHNMGLAMLGVFILWFGWFGFNPGSTLSAMDAGLIAKIAVNTNIAAAAGALAAMIVAWMRYKKPDYGMTLNGALAGLVAITAGCAYVTVPGSILIGLISGVLVVFAVELLDALHIDDPVGAIPVHLFNGVWGTIAVGLFHTEKGLLYGGGASLLGIQTLGTLSAVAFSVLIMFGFFAIIKATVGLRVSREEELRGIDVEEHGVEAYGGFDIYSTK